MINFMHTVYITLSMLNSHTHTYKHTQWWRGQEVGKVDRKMKDTHIVSQKCSIEITTGDALREPNSVALTVKRPRFRHWLCNLELSSHLRDSVSSFYVRSEAKTKIFTISQYICSYCLK